jgi:hypothetical protein
LKNKVTLQINLAPGDYLHATHILKHQLNVLAAQVDEIILTIDTKPPKGRFSNGWEEYKVAFNRFLSAEIKPNYNVRIIPVDYTDETKCKVAEYFFGNKYIPEKDYRGGPFYAYFFGLYTATNNLVLHLDSDIFLGGGSQVWVQEAIQLFKDTPGCFIVSPLPGPPHAQDKLLGQLIIEKIAPYTFELSGMSTRIFMINKSVFNADKILLSKPQLRDQLKAVIEGNPNAQLPEVLLSAFMATNLLKRIDFLGTGNGLWSLHPPYRTNTFYEHLPGMINKIEVNDLPEKQQGFYDIIDEVCDWTEARQKLKTNRWWKRLFN